MSRPRIMLVDPNDSRREGYTAFLSSRFEVSAFPVASKAQAAFPGIQPDAVLIHVRQPGGSGLTLSRALRALPGGERCMLVVYGHPAGARPSPAMIEHLRRDAGADTYLAREVDEVDLERVLGLKLLAPVEAPNVPLPSLEAVRFISANREEPTADEGSWGTALDKDGDQKGFLSLLRKQYGGLIERLPSDREVSWGELMRARANLHNVRILLDKPVTPLIHELADDRSPTVSEILRARITLRNLRIILKKGVGAPAGATPPAEAGAD